MTSKLDGNKTEVISFRVSFKMRKLIEEISHRRKMKIVTVCEEALKLYANPQELLAAESYDLHPSENSSIIISESNEKHPISLEYNEDRFSHLGLPISGPPSIKEGPKEIDIEKLIESAVLRISADLVPKTHVKHETKKVSVTTEEAARIASISRSSIYKSIADGSLSSFKVGKRRLILLKDLEAWIYSLSKNNR
ncbi:helix-turn-helix domain-containing protein [Metapseudomonas otitidis]|uniref:helix-turn-helix domain-containing protein n=1 Tax=Metapseudomonas otitidis TaxID=319939 RepID=UPI002449F5F8|nr:helix-turn-helix domain-containing protein [Pseudomonas otitidis]MDG9785243.1 helix-turn-helix domain-containing protein [Pseudomonas otitidis]